MAFFTTQRKETGSYNTKRTKPCRSRRKGKIYNEKTKNGKLTVWGAYERVILAIQNARKWADSTCRAYDSVFYHYIAEIYNDIEYASLTEETAEQIWSSKIDIFEGSDAQDQRARSIFVSFVEQACRAGLSSMRFRDLAPFVIPADLNQLTVEQLLAVREAAELCKWRPKSLTIEAEIKIYNELIKRASTQGECIALLVMLLLGCRTSEAAGLSFGNVRKMADDLYSIERREVEEQSSRTVKAGSKTASGYRLLPLLPQFYDLLEERKRMVQEYMEENGYTDLDIDKMPLACQGTNLLTRCTAKEMNRVFKDICIDVGVEEGFFFEAEAMMAIDKEAGGEYENTVVAYILRHQAATELIASDASRAAISVLMGHKIEDPNVKAFDYANADGQRELLHILMQRPLYRYICGATDMEQTTLEKGQSAVCGGSTRLVAQEDEEFDLYIDTLEPYDTMQIQLEGDIRLMKKDARKTTALPYQKPSGLSMVNAVTQVVTEAEENVRAGKLADKPVMIAQCDDPLSELLTIDDLHIDWKPQITNGNGDPIADSSEEVKMAVCEDTLIAVLPGGALKEVPKKEFVYNWTKRARRDEKIFADKTIDRVKTILPFSQSADKIVISREGTAWYLLAEVSAEEFLQADAWEECRRALAAGGIMIPCEKDADSLICGAKNGDIVRLPADKLCAWQGQRQVVRIGEAPLAAACFCKATDDILLISEKGQALRTHVSDLYKRVDIGGGLTKGMRMKTGTDDRLCCCLVYQPKRSLTVVSQQRKLLVLRVDSEEKAQLRAQGHVGEGVCLVRVEGSDRLAEVLYTDQAVLLLSDSGYAQCRDVSVLREKGRGAKGIEGMKRGQIIRAVCAKVK